MMRKLLGSVTLAGAVLVASSPTSWAEPEPSAPPNCTSADLSGVMAGVAAATSAYLFTHPEVNDFFTSLKGLPKEQMREQAAAYLDTRPQIRNELRGIRQPAVDFRNRCG